MEATSGYQQISWAEVVQRARACTTKRAALVAAATILTALRKLEQRVLLARAALFALLVTFVGPGSLAAAPPYPIVLVHGLISSDAVWTDPGGLVDHLESFNWYFGGTFHFNLDEVGTSSLLFQIDSIDLEEGPLGIGPAVSGDIYVTNFDWPGNAVSNAAAVYLQAAALKLVTARVRALTGSEKVILVGHSMGGLASAAYLVGDPDQNGNADFYADDVAKIVTLGTPFGGSVLANLVNLIGSGLPILHSSNAIRDLAKDAPAHQNIFLFGGNEIDVGTDFITQDVNGNGLIDPTRLTGINEFAVAMWPSTVDYFWVVGHWNFSTDCIVEGVDQYLASFGSTKLIHAAHSNFIFPSLECPTVASACTETRSFDSIVEALDEPGIVDRAWPLNQNSATSGFLTKHDAAGTDVDIYWLSANGSGSIEVSLLDPPVPGTTMRLLSGDGSLELDSDTGSSGELVVETSVASVTPVQLLVEVSGFVEPSDAGFGFGRDACNPTDTNCPNCRAPYTLLVTDRTGASSVELTAAPPVLAPGQASTLSAAVLDPDGAPVPAGASVTFESTHPGTFSGCDSSPSPCVASTNSSGVAQVSFSSLVQGTALVTASAATGGAGSTNVTFVSGGILASASPNPVDINLPSVITVSVTEPDGSPSGAGVSVTFSTSFPGFFSGNGAGSSSPQTLPTDGSGQTWIRYTGTASGTANITIDAPSASPVVLPLGIQQPSTDITVAISVSFSHGTGSYSDYELQAQVLDNQGVPIVGEQVDFTASRGSLDSDHCSTGITGVCDTQLRITSSGDVTVTANSRGVVSATTFFGQVDDGSVAEMFPVRTLNFSDQVLGLDYSPDGTVFVAGDKDGNLKAWNTSDWSSRWIATTSDDRSSQVSFTPNGSRVLFTHDDGVDIFNVSNGSLYCTVVNPDSKGIKGVFTSNSTFFDTSFEHVFLHTSLCDSGTSIYTMASDAFERESHMDFNSTKGWIAVGSQAGNLYVWNTSGGLVKKTPVTSGNDNGNDVDFNANGSRLLAVGYQVIKIFNTATWSATSFTAQNLPNGHLYGAKYLDSDQKIAIGAPGKIEIINVVGGSSHRVATVSGTAVEIAWDPTSEELAVGTTANKVYFFKPLAPLDTHSPVIEVFSPLNGSSTNQPQITTTGRATDATGVASFTINGTSVGLDGSGNFSHPLTLSPGSNSITYEATDLPGNTATLPIQVTLLIDQTAPVISNVGVSPGASVPGAAFTIGADADDGDSGVGSVSATVRDPSGTPVSVVPMSGVGGGRYEGSYDSTGDGDGFYTTDIIAIDASPQANERMVAAAASFAVDGTPPNDPSNVTSTTHPIGVPSSLTVITMAWTAGTDATSGVDGYAYTFTGSATPVCDEGKDLEESVTQVSSASLADGDWWFHICTVDNAGNWTSAVTAGSFVIDTTAPTQATTLISTSHTVSTWSTLAEITAEWSGATDANGIAGYSVVFDGLAATDPDTIVDVHQSGDPHSITSATQPDSNNRWFHLRVCDTAGNCAATQHLGPVWIDNTTPDNPASVTSTSHTVGTPSNDTTIDMSWTAGSDTTSGVDGYAFEFNRSGTPVCDQGKDLEETATSVSSAALSDGSWWFHICTVDNAGNWASTVTAGPFAIDGSACVVDADCIDGLFCNGVETCLAGSCQAGTPPNCDDGVGCTADSCNEGTDSCDNTSNDSFCDNGLFCDGAEICDSVNDCQAGTAVTCSDGVGCTVDSCNEGTDSCSNVPDDSLCDNGLFCDGSEVCNTVNDCQAGTAVACGDGVICTLDSCNEATDSCDNTPNDAACDNGLFCDGSESCDPALDCQAGSDPCAPMACDEEGDMCFEPAFCQSESLAIPDNDPVGVTSTMVVNAATILADLDVSVEVSHTYVGDLIFSVEHVETGTSVVIVDRPGVPVLTFGCSGDDFDATLDDEAASPVEDECVIPGPPAISGTLIPNNPLSDFDSETLSGTWRLTVSDNAGADLGTLNQWCISVGSGRLIFADGFESGDTSAWSAVVP